MKLSELDVDLIELQERIRTDILAEFQSLTNFSVTLTTKSMEMSYEDLLAQQISYVSRGLEENRIWNQMSEVEKLKWNINILRDALKQISDVSRGPLSGDFLETMRTNRDLALFQNEMSGIVEMAVLQLRATDTYNPYQKD